MECIREGAPVSAGRSAPGVRDSGDRSEATSPTCVVEVQRAAERGPVGGPVHGQPGAPVQHGVGKAAEVGVVVSELEEAEWGQV